ncbi:MAG: N-acetyltransferase family protein [Bacteroidota bacterium]
MNPYHIRLAEKKDVPSILDIYAPFILNTITSFETKVPTIDEYYQRIQKILEESPFLVCTHQSKVIGYAYASPHRSRQAYAWNREVSVYVANDFHGKKIASALYTALFELLQLQGYANVLAGIAQPNPASVAFHRKMGFKLVGTYEKVGHKFGKYVDTQWWALFIGEESAKEIKPLEQILITEEGKTAIEKGLSYIKP